MEEEAQKLMTSIACVGKSESTTFFFYLIRILVRQYIDSINNKIKIIMKEFFAAFQLSKTEIFNVAYYTCGRNTSPYFTTSGEVFARNKRDYIRCGQCQDYLLRNYKTAREFYQKWGPLHLRELTEEQYKEMRTDLEKLFDKYNSMYSQIQKDGFSFEMIKELSMRPIRKRTVISIKL